MDIKVDVSRLTEIIDGLGIIPMFRDERFYYVPGFDNYGLSNYGRLLRYYPKTNYWHKQSLVYDKKLNQDCYNMQDHKYPILRLIAWVFLGDWNIILRCVNGNYIIEHRNKYKSYLDYAPYYRRYSLNNLVQIESKEDRTRFVQSKIKGEPINYLKGLNVINQGAPIDLRKMYYRMIARSTNAVTKMNQKEYADTTICDEWRKDKNCFFDYIKNECLYYYPEKSLELDKDILGFGRNQYAPDYVCLVPRYINVLFRSNKKGFGFNIRENVLKRRRKWKVTPISFDPITQKKKREKCLHFDTFAEALDAGRKNKSRYILQVVDYETQRGFIRQNILDAMREHAKLIVEGKSPIFDKNIESKLIPLEANANEQEETK